MLASDPLVISNQPRGSLSLTVNMGLVLVARNRYSIPELHERVHQGWKQAKGFGGILAVFSPKHSGVVVHFPETCPDMKWSVNKDDKIVAEGEGEPEVELDFGDKHIRKADYLLLSCRPDHFSLK
jgi:hypothetical protein